MRPSIIETQTQAGFWALSSQIPGATAATVLYQTPDPCMLFGMLNYYTTAFEDAGWQDITPAAARCERWYRKDGQRAILRWCRIPGMLARERTFVDVSSN